MLPNTFNNMQSGDTREMSEDWNTCTKADLMPSNKDATISDESTLIANSNQTLEKHISYELAYKHPLQNRWTFWYLEKDRTKAWEDMQNEITSFNTVEDFWSLYNHIKPPSEIKMGSDYSMFKEGIRPMWEDDANKNGGRWVITLHKNARTDLDSLWLDVLLCLIGEAFEHSNEICGAVVNIRGKSNKISVWTANGDYQEAAIEIGRKLQECLHLGKQLLQYELHRDTMVKSGANVQAIYTL